MEEKKKINKLELQLFLKKTIDFDSDDFIELLLESEINSQTD